MNISNIRVRPERRQTQDRRKANPSAVKHNKRSLIVAQNLLACVICVVHEMGNKICGSLHKVRCGVVVHAPESGGECCVGAALVGQNQNKVAKTAKMKISGNANEIIPDQAGFEKPRCFIRIQWNTYGV